MYIKMDRKAVREAEGPIDRATHTERHALIMKWKCRERENFHIALNTSAAL